MKKFLIFILLVGVSKSLQAQFYFNINTSGQTNINGGTNYTVTGTNPKIITATATGVVIHPDVISHYLNLGTSVTLVSPSGYSIEMDLNVNPTSPATLIFESQAHY